MNKLRVTQCANHTVSWICAQSPLFWKLVDKIFFSIVHHYSCHHMNGKRHDLQYSSCGVLWVLSLVTVCKRQLCHFGKNLKKENRFFSCYGWKNVKKTKKNFNEKLVQGNSDLIIEKLVTKYTKVCTISFSIRGFASIS